MPGLDVAGRLPRLRSRLADAGHEALLVTGLANVRYLSGFTGSAALLLVDPAGVTLLTDGRYREQATRQLDAAGVTARLVVGTVPEQHGAVAAAVRGRAHLALEDHLVTWSQVRQLEQLLAPTELVPAGSMVEDLRRAKDAGEVARVAAACAIGDDAFACLAPRLAAGPTEREVALELEVEMRRRGASGVSFPPIVAAGPNAAMPHARPSERPIARGELVVLDFGCVVDGYCSDMTRTVSVGDPGPEARRLWDVVREAQRAGRAAVRAGAEAAVVDAACRDVVAAAGLADAFVHSTGHGVGLEIHEDPRVAATSRGSLRDGDVVTVEPGVYVPGTGGVRIEDTVAVTPGGAEVLTRSPKELVL